MGSATATHAIFSILYFVVSCIDTKTGNRGGPPSAAAGGTAPIPRTLNRQSLFTPFVFELLSVCTQYRSFRCSQALFCRHFPTVSGHPPVPFLVSLSIPGQFGSSTGFSQRQLHHSHDSTCRLDDCSDAVERQHFRLLCSLHFTRDTH